MVFFLGVFDMTDGKGRERMEAVSTASASTPPTGRHLALVSSNTHIMDYPSSRKHRRKARSCGCSSSR